MALLFLEGFDHYGTTNTDISNGLRRKWSDTPATNTFNITTGRFGGYGAAFGSSSYLLYNVNNLNEAVVGFAFKQTSASVNPVQLLGFRDFTTVQSSLILASSSIAFHRSTNTVLSDWYTVKSNVWYFIEVKANIHNSTGSFEFRVNGTTIDSGTGLDTATSSNNYFTNNYLTIAAGVSYSIDDFYLCDTSGSYNNDFLGEIKIETLTPTGDGTYTDWTPVGASSAYEAVYDTTPDDDTTYAETTITPGNKSTYTFTSLSSITTVHGVQVSNLLRKDDVGTRITKELIISNAAEVSGNNYTVLDSYDYSSTPSDIDPDTVTTWSTSAVNSIQAGVELDT